MVILGTQRLLRLIPAPQLRSAPRVRAIIIPRRSHRHLAAIDWYGEADRQRDRLPDVRGGGFKPRAAAGYLAAYFVGAQIARRLSHQIGRIV
jgi:hypothetical protein